MKYLFIIAAIFLVYTGLAKDKVYTKNGLAIDGYDTVNYFTKRTAAKGINMYSYKYMGFTWQFSTSENLKLFKANPEKYMPQYGGYCAYGLGDGGYLAPVDPTAFKILDDRLFLNYSHSINKKWLKKTDYYIERGDKVWKNKYAAQ